MILKNYSNDVNRFECLMGKAFVALFTYLMLANVGLAQAAADDDEVYELSPFTIDAENNEGYYTPGTMAAGRLNTSLKNIGTSIQAVTKEFMEDVGATGIEELLQYTTSTEVGGALGNYSAASETTGNLSTQGARENPAAATRVRGLTAPDMTRGFFPTDLPFDTYNTNRVDIVRGANSFLFGLGSPAGVLNADLARAEFREINEIGTRIGSGGRSPSYRTTFDFNRALIEDKLAFRVMGLMNRTQYRQRPTFKDDDRIYGAFTYRPFGDANTVLRGHMERGEILGNAPDTLLPGQNLSTVLANPASFDTTRFMRHPDAYAGTDVIGGFLHPEGASQAQYDAMTPEAQSAYDQAGYVIRNSGGAQMYQTSGLLNGSFGSMTLVYDGRNGRDPSFVYSDSIHQLAIDKNRAGDTVLNYWNPGGPLGNQHARSVYPNNMRALRETTWYTEGFVNLDTFDFSRYLIAADNDFNSMDFFNYNFSLQQLFLGGKAGIEVSYDFQDNYRKNDTSMRSSPIAFDTQKTLLLPADPNYLNSGNLEPLDNPNYGRAFLDEWSGAFSIRDNQREAKRFTGYFKHDFAENTGSDFLGDVFGNHTLTVLGDESSSHETILGYFNAVGGDLENRIHQQHRLANTIGTIPTIVRGRSYLGPQQLGALTDPSFTLADFTLEPANYDLHRPKGYSIDRLYWNLGPEANFDNIGKFNGANNVRANGNESWQTANLAPTPLPNRNSTLVGTATRSLAANSQSIFLDGLLVANLGYREDRVQNFLRRGAPLVAPGFEADLRPEVFNLDDTEPTSVEASVFGYGGVFYWPKEIVKLPEMFDDIIFHYNESENFIPEVGRLDHLGEGIPSPTGASKDWGVSFYMYNNKLVARLNWYESSLENATTSAGPTYNRTVLDTITYAGNLMVSMDTYDNNGDGLIDQSFFDDESVNHDPETGLNPEGQTLDEAIMAKYPNLARSKLALAEMDKFVKNPSVIEAWTIEDDGAGGLKSLTMNPSETQSIKGEGFEAEFIFNPTKSWRIALNAAQNETRLSDVGPRLGKLLDDVWYPHFENFADLDYTDPVAALDGQTIEEHTLLNLTRYFVLQANEGKANGEQREWRVNLVTRYAFREGMFKGFTVGGAIRWEDEYWGGYQDRVDTLTGLILPDTGKPYILPTEAAIDLNFGYSKQISQKVLWKSRINLRNIDNISNDHVNIIRVQPDGSPARARLAPAFNVTWSNTFSF
jgi:hypothetical protein